VLLPSRLPLDEKWFDIVIVNLRMTIMIVDGVFSLEKRVKIILMILAI